MVDKKNDDGSVEFTSSEQGEPKTDPTGPDAQKEALKAIEQNMADFMKVMEGFAKSGDDLKETVKECHDLLAEVEPLIKLYSK